MRSEIRQTRPSNYGQSESIPRRSEKPRDVQEPQLPSANSSRQRSVELAPAHIEQAVRHDRFSCGCMKFRQDTNAPDVPQRALCQKSFFVCTVKKFGNLPGAGSIYVETVIDCTSGTAFAKVYSGKSAMNGVDILHSRVLPHFERRGREITALHTLSTSEYCGLSPIHPFEAFLSACRIRHLALDDACPRCRQLCDRFYHLLLKDFFAAALRKTFQLSLPSLQRELDEFVESHNARDSDEEHEPQDNFGLPANFSVHP
jgi:hypothetical protein